VNALDTESSRSSEDVHALHAWLERPELYSELTRLAGRVLARGRPATTLNTTALAHEAYLRLRRPDAASQLSRAHLLNLAAQAMRQIVCDVARQRLRDRARTERRDPDALERMPDDAEAREAQDLLQLDDALRRLSEREPRQARVVAYRFFAGLTEEETALALDAPLRSVQRDWSIAREWLRRELGN
jgi:RNA polymerase sigma factor (TIGR02999 family)